MGLMRTPEEIADDMVTEHLIEDDEFGDVVSFGIEDAIAKAIKQEREKIDKLTAEVMAWRDCPHEHFNKVWSQPQMSGLHRSEYMQRIIDARRVVDEAGLLDEWLLKKVW